VAVRRRWHSESAHREIETTRPELIPACVALVAHPDDERYKPLFGTNVITPLFGVEVPVKAHPLADPERERHRDDLHVRRHHRRHVVARAVAASARVIQPNGALAGDRVGAPGWESTDPARAQQEYDQLANLSSLQGARA
jgi:valyl-tRNA synthetase